MDKLDLIKIENKELSLISEEDTALVQDCVAQVKDLQMAPDKSQWEYTLERSLVKLPDGRATPQYPTNEDRYLQCKIQIYTILGRIIERHYEHNKLQAETDILEAEICQLNDKEVLGVEEIAINDANIRLKKNDIAMKKFKMYSLKYCLSQDIIELNNFKELGRKYNPDGIQVVGSPDMGRIRNLIDLDKAKRG